MSPIDGLGVRASPLPPSGPSAPARRRGGRARPGEGRRGVGSLPGNQGARPAGLPPGRRPAPPAARRRPRALRGLGRAQLAGLGREGLPGRSEPSPPGCPGCALTPRTQSFIPAPVQEGRHSLQGLVGEAQRLRLDSDLAETGKVNDPPPQPRPHASGALMPPFICKLEL